MRRCDDRRMRGEAEIIVCAEVDYLVFAHADLRALRREDDALFFVESCVADLAERAFVDLFCPTEHGRPLSTASRRKLGSEDICCSLFALPFLVASFVRRRMIFVAR